MTDYTNTVDSTTMQFENSFSQALQQSGIDSNTLAALGGFFIAFFLIFIILALVAYILGSIGLQTLAKNKGYDNPWLAWIPFASNYLSAKVGFNNIGIAWGYTLFVILCIFIKLPHELLILTIIGIIVSYFIFKRFSKNYVLLTVINVLTLGIANAFILFAIRNNQEIEK